MLPPYRDLYFGKSDSRNEHNDDPDAFVRTYVDLHGASREVVAGQKFLVLGPKGTGKSALAWYLDATGGRGEHLALVRDASSLPLAEVPRLQTGQEPGPERTVVAWRFILLCNYLELLIRDQGCSVNRNPEALRVARLLRGFGFMGDASGRALLKFSTTTVSIPIPKLGQIYKRESQAALNIYNLIPYLEEWVAEAASAVRHVLIIDGLDSIFLNDVRYDESLASLVQAAYILNQRLRESGASGSAVLLLRNDVFARVALSLPDSQKMRDDLSLELDWRVLSGAAGVNAPLLQLVNAKAGRAANVESIDVLGYFPATVTVGSAKQGHREIDTFRYLLNLTRHTPRDLLRLLEEIRRVDAAGIFGRSDGMLPQDVIHEGVLQYSTKYFVGAINNEFAGYAEGQGNAAAALTALKLINKQTFDAAEFKAALEATGAAVTVGVEELLRLLFFAGAIGNYLGGGASDQSYMQFYHRREESEIYLKGSFILHNALIHAWGLRRRSKSPETRRDDEAEAPTPPTRVRRRTNRIRDGAAGPSAEHRG